MTDFLVRRFVKNSNDINNPAVRKSYGTLSSLTGIVCNIFLFVLKYVMGTLSGSISIISDAFNNLSDCAGCIVTLLGYKMASKPADRDHPFGHGRMEYLTALFIAVLIIIVAAELFKGSVRKIIHPQSMDFSIIVLASLAVSILIKLWMSFFNLKLGRRINSAVMLATSKDSRTDVIATSATCISIISAPFTGLPVDGIMGIVVSLFVLKSGVDIVKDTADSLLGRPADREIAEAINGIVTENERIIGVHDLMLHNYGPGRTIGTCHAEVRSTEDFIEIHDLIDRIEREVQDKLGIMMTIHMDPVEVDNAYVNKLNEMVRSIVAGIDPILHIHDFRAVVGETHTNLIFDVVVPYDCRHSEADIKNAINEKLNKTDADFYAVITFDREY